MRTIHPLVAAAIIAGGCTDAASVAPTGDETSTRLAISLCEAAAADETTTATAAFGRAHDDLHALARTLQETDLRGEAAVLLEAKQQVEESVDREADVVELTPRLSQLVDATSAALTALDRPPLPCD